MHLFTENINNWHGRSKIFQSIPTLFPLIKHIFQKENLPFTKIENLTPGTNAVFKVGRYVIKIFAPVGEEGHKKDYGTNVEVELFGMRLANRRGVPSPNLLSEGTVCDKYSIRYLLMEYVDGKLFEEIESSLTYEDKVFIGRNVRKITDRLNVACDNFTHIDLLEYAKASKDWLDEGSPESFETERQAYLAEFRINDEDKVYCHGDFHPGNILVDGNMNVFIVDFADAMHAPAEYELLYVVSALFCFEKPYMVGYFGGDYEVDDILNLCMKWLPVHAWGHATAEGNLKNVGDVTSFAVLRERLYRLIKSGKEKSKNQTARVGANLRNR